MSKTRWSDLNRRIVNCDQCTRLREHCLTVAQAKRKSYSLEDYWGRPVANFGSPRSDLLIVGLAPGAHGANRTGRMFTGDRSGVWLFRALHRFGFANQAESTRRDDGLTLQNCVITNICRCAPPDNKPLRTEIAACQPYFAETLELCRPRILVALGGLAWTATINQLLEIQWLEPIGPQRKFSHLAQLNLTNGRVLIGSYHPSQQNTFTGRLTETMLDDVFRLARSLISAT